MVARIVLWDLAESATSVDELRDWVAGLAQAPGDRWIWNAAQERFPCEGEDQSAVVKYENFTTGVRAAIY